ncbi:MAG TPA: thioredoxin family protein [Gracilimonas sp.]|uniref:thioredoxin family protein n=1 Tax=Gracilimonas sp. TaxID=1974203 RepID=UPI002DA55A4F|nr:thioredoxin family protein [Gracilimonas sp.]
MQNVTNTLMDEEIITDAYTYHEYSQLIEEGFKSGRTTNNDNRQNMLDHTKINIHRSLRWDKRGEISSELTQKLIDFRGEMVWLVISEGWCGDSAQTIPFINKMAEISDNITLRIILRDENPEVMDMFLTNGSRSIPKLIALESKTMEVLGTWGPRPEEAHEQYITERKDPSIPNSIATENLHLWYARDKGKSIQNEFMELLKKWEEEFKI